ncbi:NPCBM-associated, NEW3 domain of alpha-galactosidase [compost metagenome]
MRNSTFCKPGFSRLIFLIVFLLLTVYSASAQFYTKHYIAPAPWQYFSKANELVISTNSIADVDITVAKSDGTTVTTLKAKKGSPAVYRFSLLARDLPMNALNTVLNGVGLIVTSTGPTAVNLRNIASDDYDKDENRDANIKGNAALTSFGDAGLGIRFRVGYYRDGSLGTFSSFGEQRPIYSIMATANNTTIKINNAVTATLNLGQSYLFKAPIGTLVESSNPIVMNTAAAIDMPGGCGDGAYNQIPPESVLGTEYFLERGTGNDTAEQTTVVATKDDTNITVESYSTTGVLVNRTTINLASAGSFHTFINGVKNTSFTASRIIADKRVAVYSGTAQNCEVDISTIAPVSECGGSEFVETSKFKNYKLENLDYFGYILLRSSSEDVTINGVKTTSIAGVKARYQIGSTGWYIINFNSEQIGRPEVLSIESKAKLTVSIVQQAGGFSMAGFFSTFASLPDDPTLTYIEGGGCTNNSARLTTQTGFDPYQWYYNGTAISGANSSTYIATKTGNYSVSYTLACGAQTPSKTASVILCTDLGITKTVDIATPCIGSNVEFTVKVSNLGGNNVSGISVTDLLPSGYTYVSSIPSVGIYDSTTGIWSIGDVEAQSSMTLKIVATVNASGNYTNTASLPNGIDTNTANNSASAAVNPKSANLVVTNPASVCAPSTVNLTASAVTAGSSSNLTLSYWTNSGATASLSSPNAVTASGTYYIKAVSADGCTFVKPVVVTINPQPSVPTITSRTNNANINNGSISCFGGTSIILRATSSAGYLWSTGETTQDITVTTDGTYSVKVLNSLGCISDSSSGVFVTFTPTAPTAAANQSFCASENKKVKDLVATGSNLKWYSASTNGTQYAENATLTAGNYYVSQTSANGCESSRTQVKVTISASSAPVASAQTFCFAENKKISDLNLGVSGNNLKWYNQLSGGTQYAGTETLVTGNYYVSQTAGTCPESARTLVVVTINNVPSAPTASSQTFCATDSKTVNDLKVTSGSNLKWYNQLTGGTLYNGTETLSSGNYYVSQTNDCGESTRTTVSVTVNNTAAPTASAQTFCSGELKKVSNLSPSGAAYKWYSANTGGTLYSGNETLATGTYYVSQIANGCESLRTAVNVIVNETPAAPSASAQTFCSSENKKVKDLVATGSNLKWYNSSTGGTQYLGDETLASSNYYVSQTLNACESTRLLVSVTVNPTPATPSISADGATIFCQGGSVVLTSTGGSGYLWSTGATTQSITVSASGNYSVQVTNASGCPSSFSTPVTVTVNSIPTAPTASAQTFCSSDNKKVGDLSPSGASYKWYSANTGGTLYTGTEMLSTGTYYVSQTTNGCESSRTSVSVTVNTTPTAPTASAQTFCSSDNKKVGDLSPSGASYKWYSANTGGTLYTGTEMLSTGTYYVSQTTNGCESSRTSVSVTVNSMPSAPILSDIIQPSCLVATGSFTINNYNSAYNYIITPSTGVTNNAGTITAPAGSYTISVYSNGCSSGDVSFVIKSILCANDDDFGTKSSGSTSATIGNVKTNDTLDGVFVTSTNTVVMVDSSGPLSVDANGDVTLAANTPSGTYSITYEICEKNANPANCKTGAAEVKVANTIDAVIDTVTPINGNIGGTTLSLIGNDKLNGNQAVIGTNSGEVTINIVGTLPSGLTLNVNGTITIAPNTPKGNYSVEYIICEVGAVPANCDSVTITIPVTAGNLVANEDIVPSFLGSNVPQTLGKNVFDNDTKNAQPLNPSDVTLKTTVADAKGYLTVDTDGNIVLGANPPTGDYELTYEICEKLNPDNCSSNTVKVTVGTPVIDAVEDTVASINGNIGGTTISLIANDKLNGSPILVGTAAGEVKFEIIGTLPTGLTLNSDYTITVAPNTPKGDYKVEYKICENTNPTNCDSVTITIPVTAGNLVANEDIVPSFLGSNVPQTLGKNVFDNDTKNAQPLNPSDVTLKTTAADPKGYLTVDTDGNIVLGANPPAGDYELTYEICEKLNPDNCSSNTVKVTVGTPVIDAVEDLIASINGNIGGTTISLIANDKLNGNPIVVGTAAGEVKFEIVGTLPTGLTLNSDYTITVAPNTPAADYNVEYKICENTNPTNCDSVIITVPVTAGNLVANEDLVPSAVGVNISQKVINVFENDTKDGNKLAPSDVDLKVTQADPKGYLTVDAEGNVVLAPNAPAGEYELTYTICEKLNPNNCDSNIVKVTVAEPKMTVKANSYCSNNVPYVNYTVTPDNFTTNNLLTVKWIDSNNNVVATETNLPLSGNILWPGAEIDSNQNGIDWPGWILNNGIWAEGADGFEATRNGVKLEFSLNPTVSVSVAYPPATPDCNARPTFSIKANNDEAGPINVKKGADATINIFENDLLNGAKIKASDVVLSVPDVHPNISLNADGSINIATNTPDGVYELTYQICEAANSSNCSQAVIKITVDNVVDPAPPTENKITLNNDNDVSADGINGSLEFVNVLDNDLINGQPINPADVTIKPLTESPYFEWNADGTVNVKPNTPGGNYPLTYQVCEKANSSNCSSATLNVFVEVPAISVVKTAVFNDENKSGFANAGETITYKFTVTNTGNVPLVGITVNDPLPGVVVSGQAINLGVNESNETNFIAVYKITQEDINRGSVSNQATVKGSSVRGVVVEDQSDDASNSGDSPTVLDLNGCSIKVMNAFSPNGDSKNARFYIRGIECYPDNTVEIYNRWGVLVFNIDQYNNNDRVFVGYSNGRSTIKQTDGLPVGTYFYILKYKDSAQKSHQESGYLYLNK